MTKDAEVESVRSDLKDMSATLLQEIAGIRRDLTDVQQQIAFGKGAWWAVVFLGGFIVAIIGLGEHVMNLAKTVIK